MDFETVENSKGLCHSFYILTLPGGERQCEGHTTIGHIR